MNFLGHIVLAYPNPAHMVGNFIADGLRPVDRKGLPIEIDSGVKMHYAIDRFVDEHHAFKSSLQLLRPDHGKYAAVVLDIINDYFLASEWGKYMEIDHDDFIEEVYELFKPFEDKLFGKAEARLAQLLRYRYLHAYSQIEGIADVMKRMDKRTRFPSNFALAIKNIADHREEFSANFGDLFGEVKGYIHSWSSESI